MVGGLAAVEFGFDVGYPLLSGSEHLVALHQHVSGSRFKYYNLFFMLVPMLQQHARHISCLLYIFTTLGHAVLHFMSLSSAHSLHMRCIVLTTCMTWGQTLAERQPLRHAQAVRHVQASSTSSCCCSRKCVCPPLLLPWRKAVLLSAAQTAAHATLRIMSVIQSFA
jgi:hypothetical protein